MKKVIAGFLAVITVLVIVIITLAAAITNLGLNPPHSKTIYNTPSQFDTITYDALLEFGGDFSIGDYISIESRIGDIWSISASFDKNSGEKDAENCERAVQDLTDILTGQILYAVKMPVGDPNYNYGKYYIDYDEYAGEYRNAVFPMGERGLLHVYIPTLPAPETPADALTLHGIGLSMKDDSKCYILVNYYQKNDEKHQKSYTYYTEDEQLIENLLEWAETCLELDNAQPYEYNPDA